MRKVGRYQTHKRQEQKESKGVKGEWVGPFTFGRKGYELDWGFVHLAFGALNHQMGQNAPSDLLHLTLVRRGTSYARSNL